MRVCLEGVRGEQRKTADATGVNTEKQSKLKKLFGRRKSSVEV